jgi:hypothetical protein
MPRNSAVLDDAPAAPAIQPEMLSKLKKEDMKQAVVERFRATSEAPAPMKAKERKRSPYWRPADEEC